MDSLALGHSSLSADIVSFVVCDIVAFTALILAAPYSVEPHNIQVDIAFFLSCMYNIVVDERVQQQSPIYKIWAEPGKKAQQTSLIDGQGV